MILGLELFAGAASPIDGIHNAIYFGDALFSETIGEMYFVCKPPTRPISEFLQAAASFSAHQNRNQTNCKQLISRCNESQILELLSDYDKNLIGIWKLDAGWYLGAI